MEVFLVRHTSPDVPKGICYGQTDLPLAATYQEEFEQVSSQIPADIDHFFCSPLQRCALLAKYLGANVITDERLIEMDFGKWEMQAWNDIPKEEWQPWSEDYFHVAPPGGENLIALKERMFSFWEQLCAQRPAKVVVVTHAGPIRTILGYIRGLPMEEWMSIPLHYGEVNKLEV